MDSEELQETITSHDKSEQNATNSQVISLLDNVSQANDMPARPETIERMKISPPTMTVYAIDQTSMSNEPTPLVVPSSQHQRSLTEWGHIWWHGIRPSYLSLSLMPILLGTTLAWMQTISKQEPFGQLHFSHLIGTIVIIGCLQVGAHLINDYYDYIRGIDTENIFSSGGLIQQGYIKPLLVLNVGLWLLGIGSMLSIFLAASLNGFLYFFCGLLVVGAYFYSALPRALSILPHTEVIGFFLFGPLLTLCAYMTQSKMGLPMSVFLYSLPVGFLAMAVIHANNIRDRETDASAHKSTLANLTDKQLSRYLYLGMVVLAYIIVLLLGFPQSAPHAILICLWTLPLLAIVIIRVITTKTPAGFHGVTRETLKLEVYFVILLIIGLALSSLWPVFPEILAHYLSV